MFAFAKPDNITAFPQKSNEWYTPSRYIEAAREVMGGIDLDPASCELANRTVKAARFYTERENGLKHPWYGRVWCNPPFGKIEGHISSLELWTVKLTKEYQSGNIEQATLLVPAYMANSWFMALWEYPMCFPDSRIHYYNKHTLNWRPKFGSALIYLGTHEQTFIDVFSQFGTIAKRVSQPKQQVIPLSLWDQEGVMPHG